MVKCIIVSTYLSSNARLKRGGRIVCLNYMYVSVYMTECAQTHEYIMHACMYVCMYWTL